MKVGIIFNTKPRYLLVVNMEPEQGMREAQSTAHRGAQHPPSPNKKSLLRLCSLMMCLSSVRLVETLWFSPYSSDCKMSGAKRAWQSVNPLGHRDSKSKSNTLMLCHELKEEGRGWTSPFHWKEKTPHVSRCFLIAQIQSGAENPKGVEDERN